MNYKMFFDLHMLLSIVTIFCLNDDSSHTFGIVICFGGFTGFLCSSKSDLFLFVRCGNNGERNTVSLVAMVGCG